MMENLPFSCGWGWDVSLSLEKEFEGAAGAILRWISFELWNSLDWTMGSCGDFCFKGFQPVSICFFLRPQRRTLYSGPFQVLPAPFVSKYIFQDGGIRTSTSFGGRSFIHCFAERVERLHMFIYSDRVKVLYCFVWNYRNLETCTFLRWLWICCCVSSLYALLDSVSYGSWADVEEKTPKHSSKWTLNVGNFL